MSRCGSPFRITPSLPKVKTVRVARNSSLPALPPATNASLSRLSIVGSVTNQQQQQPDQRQRSHSTAIISSRRTVTTAASQTLLLTELKSRKQSLPKIDILNSSRTSQAEYKTERLPVITPEVISEVPGKKIKLQDILKSSVRNSTPNPYSMNSSRRNPYDHKFVSEHFRVLQLQMENEQIETEEGDEVLDWESEQNSRWLGRSIDEKEENEREGDLFWRFPQNVKSQAANLYRGIHREASPDLVKCLKCKKCRYCLACKKCTLSYDCADCLKCIRCIKCPKCIEKADLSPEREPDFKKEFFDRFKNLDSLDRKGMLRKNPRDYYLKACQVENILPVPLDALNQQDSDAKRMSFRHYGITNQRAKAIASSITVNEDLENVDFTSAGLHGQGMADVLKRLNYKVRSVDLTNNKMDTIGLKAIMGLLMNRKYSYLTTLCLEGMAITDRAGEILVNGLVENNNLMILNLSRNHIANRTMDVLAKFLEESNTIQQIYLHWNKITWKGCCSLSEGAARSESLKVLDLSWNKIGHTANKVSSQKLADMIIRNKSIVHLDMSFCGFREEETNELAKGLQLNQTIIGVHLAGSKFTADDMGFLQRITNMETAVLKDALWKRIPLGERVEREKAIRGTEGLKATGNCWICEGWKEVKFIWKNTLGLVNPEPVHLHLGYDNWKGWEMKQDKDDKNTYVLFKMVPPGTLKFYFSIQGEKTDLGEYDETFEDLPEPEQIHDAKKTQLANVQNLVVPRVSLMTVEYFDPLESETLDLALERCVPRPRPPGLKIDNTWRFKTSIFKTYKRDDTNLEKKCFEFDFEIGRLRKLINKNKEDINEVKNTIWQYYPKLRAAFKFYSSMSPIGEVFSMPLNPYTEFMTQIGVIDGQDLKLHAVDKNFIAVKSNKEHKGKLNPEKALLRGQFIEALVRNAEEKYMITKKTDKYVDAINWFMKDAMKHCEEFDHNAFRLERLWNPYNDFVYQANLNIMKSVYHKYCDHTNALKNRKNWDQADYDKFLRDLEVINVYITEREPLLFFNLAMMTQVDELSSNRHLRMTFVEFLDVFARIADRLTPTIDNPMTYLYQKIAELVKVAAKKCLNIADYKVLTPPVSLKDKIIDLSY